MELLVVACSLLMNKIGAQQTPAVPLLENLNQKISAIPKDI